VIAFVRRELATNAVSVRMELSSGLPKICGDRIQLQQVLINLVVNGIEAMQANVDRPRELAIRSSQAGEDGDRHLLLTVRDRGVGLGCDVTDHIFTPFFTTKSSGLGMGLSICRSIIEAHAGRLSALPNEGSGATFQIALPFPHKDTS
jgi:C4-dicarboxylate-specific signal transduction histidine kinase